MKYSLSLKTTISLGLELCVEIVIPGSARPDLDIVYLFIENFLKDPDKTKSLLDNYPAIDGGVYTPGARQNFTPMDLVPIVSAYGQLLEKDPTKFLTSSLTRFS